MRKKKLIKFASSCENLIKILSEKFNHQKLLFEFQKFVMQKKLIKFAKNHQKII